MDNEIFSFILHLGTTVQIYYGRQGYVIQLFGEHRRIADESHAYTGTTGDLSGYKTTYSLSLSCLYLCAIYTNS